MDLPGYDAPFESIIDWLVALTYAECEVEPDCLRRSTGAIWGYEGWWEPACVKHLLLAEEMGLNIWVRPPLRHR